MINFSAFTVKTILKKMKNRTLYIVRGLPGSGKSTLAKKLCPRDAYEADDWFVDHDGIYKFDPSQLSKAHRYCQIVVKNAMSFT